MQNMLQNSMYCVIQLENNVYVCTEKRLEGFMTQRGYFEWRSYCASHFLLVACLISQISTVTTYCFIIRKRSIKYFRRYFDDR